MNTSSKTKSVFFYSSGSLEGLAGTRPFYFDINLENIIIPGKVHLAYKIGLFDPDQLTLELNRELTEQLNKEYP